MINTCLTGYLKSTNSLFCTKCPSNCISCPVSDSICASCNTGYYINNSLCSICTINNCLSCSRVGSVVVCTQCNTGYYLSSGNCISCQSNCQRCTTSTSCSQCKPGYTISGSSCITVTTTITNCNIYSNGTTCSSCLTGFYLSSNSCFPCSIMCSQCIGRHFGLCITCNNNAYLFNQMCLPSNFPSRTSYQSYYSLTYNPSLFSNGASACLNTLYVGSSISIAFNNLWAYQISINWKIYTTTPNAVYSVQMNNQSQTFNSGTLAYTYCSTNYYLSIQSNNFSEIYVNNSLIISNSGSIAFE